MTRSLLGLCTAATLIWPALAAAQTPAPAAPPPAAPSPAAAPAPTAAAPAVAPSTPAKDNRNMQGITPFWQAVKNGDAAYAARDFDAAIAAYRDAVEKDPKSPLPHYRLGEAQLAKGDLAEAEASWQTGMRFAGTDHRIRAKFLFVLADLRERQKNYDEALAHWKDYAQHAQAQPEAKAFPATAAEREKRITEWKKISADSALVKERIEKRMKETEESMRKSSK